MNDPLAVRFNQCTLLGFVRKTILSKLSWVFGLTLPMPLSSGALPEKHATVRVLSYLDLKIT